MKKRINLFFGFENACYSWRYATATGSGKRQLVRTGTCPAALSQKANGYRAPANNRAIGNLREGLASILGVHISKPSYQSFNGMEKNAFIVPFMNSTLRMDLYTPSL